MIKKSEIALSRADQRPNRYNRGDRLDVAISSLEFAKRKVSLSIKALEEKVAKEAVKKYGSTDSGGVLGDILGKALNLKKKKK